MFYYFKSLASITPRVKFWAGVLGFGKVFKIVSVLIFKFILSIPVLILALMFFKFVYLSDEEGSELLSNGSSFDDNFTYWSNRLNYKGSLGLRFKSTVYYWTSKYPLLGDRDMFYFI